jgi:hypothetical protein
MWWWFQTMIYNFKKKNKYKPLKHEVLALMIGLAVCNYHIRHLE